MKPSVILPGLMAAAAMVACAGPRTPRAATIREPDGTLRPVWGLPANLVTGDALPVGRVQAAAFSGSAGIVLSHGAVRVLTLDGVELGAYITAEVKPVLSILGDPNTAVAWLPSEGKLIRWNGSGFVATAIEPAALPGPVIDVYLKSGKQIQFLLGSTSNSLTRAAGGLKEGPVVNESSIPNAGSNAIQMGLSLLFQDARGLEIESPNGAMKTLPMRESDLVYERAGMNCIHVMSMHGRQWLLHIDSAEPALSEIPQVFQSASVSIGDAK